MITEETYESFFDVYEKITCTCAGMMMTYMCNITLGVQDELAFASVVADVVYVEISWKNSLLRQVQILACTATRMGRQIPTLNQHSWHKQERHASTSVHG